LVNDEPCSALRSPRGSAMNNKNYRAKDRKNNRFTQAVLVFLKIPMEEKSTSYVDISG